MQANDYAPGAGMSAPVRVAGQALQVIDGETKARDYLARLQAQQADPGELAVIVSMMYGATLYGFARVIEKALGGRHV